MFLKLAAIEHRSCSEFNFDMRPNRVMISATWEPNLDGLFFGPDPNGFLQIFSFAKMMRDHKLGHPIWFGFLHRVETQSVNLKSALKESKYFFPGEFRASDSGTLPDKWLDPTKSPELSKIWPTGESKWWLREILERLNGL